MSALGSPSPLFLASAADAAATGQIKSVRFNSSDSAHLTRSNPNEGSQRKFTFSFWVKRAKLGGGASNANHSVFFAGPSPDSAKGLEVRFDNNDRLYVETFATSSTSKKLITNRVFRDPSAWYHIVLAFDTTSSTENNRLIIYVNGEQVSTSDLSTNNQVAQNFDYRYVGESNADHWKAVTYSGTYGSNGYHLFDFANESTVGHDSSGNEDDWTANNISGSTISAFNLNVTSTPFTDTGTGVTITNYGGVTTASAGTNSFNLGTVATFGGSGSGDFLKGSTIAFGDAYTIDYYFNPNSSQVSNATVIDIGAEASIRDYGGQTSRTIRLKDSGGSRTDYSYTASTGWNHVRVTNTGIWVNGTSVNSSPRSMSGTSGTLYIGTYNNSTSYLFNGKIGPMRIDTGSNQGAPASGGLVASSDGTLPELSSANTDSDVLFDVATNGNSSDDSGAGGEVSGNYATLNPNILGTYISSRSTISNGNLQFVNTQYATLPSTIAMSSGKWYCEGTLDALASASNQVWAGLLRTSAEKTAYEYFQGNAPAKGVHYWGDNTGLNRTQSYGVSYATAGTVIGIAFDADAGSCTWYVNGSSQGASTYNIVQGEEYFFSFGAYTNGAWTVNFGQRAFAYSAPSGYKALCTTNLPDATVTNGSNHQDTVIYTGNGSSLTITGLEFSPDFVWLKGQSVAAGHGLFDTVRGATKRLLSHTTSSELTNSEYQNSFTSDGFSVGNHSSVNTSSETFAAWTWDAGSSTASNTDGSITSSVRANQTAGFSIVSWTGTGTAGTIGHGLNADLGLIAIKNRDTATDWVVWHSDFAANERLRLNRDFEKGVDNGFMNATLPTSSVFSVGTVSVSNTNGDDYIAYCFSPVAGYSAFGSYMGNGLADGPFIYLGFRPAWIMYKAIDESSSAADWFIRDYKRLGFNHTTDASNNPELEANGAASENNNGPIDMLSNGFKIKSNNAGHNTNNKNYMYFAFAQNPFQANGGLAR
jgi:hypothetical protein